MSDIGKPERITQNRVIALFCDELKYRYLGDWTDREGNSNVEEALLTAYLSKRGYTPAQISVAMHKLRIEADNHGRTLYGNNQAVYNLLRFLRRTGEDRGGQRHRDSPPHQLGQTGSRDCRASEATPSSWLPASMRPASTSLFDGTGYAELAVLPYRVQ